MFEDGVGLVRSLKQLGYSPKTLFQTSAPSNAGQYSDGIGDANTEGVFYTVCWNEKAETPKNAEFVKAYGDAVRQCDPRPRTRRTRSPRPRCSRPREELGASTRPRSRTGCTATRSQTILGPLSGTRRVLRRTTSCWRSGRTVRSDRGPTEAATTQEWSTPSPPGTDPDDGRHDRIRLTMDQLLQAMVLGLLIGGVYALMARA